MESIDDRRVKYLYEAVLAGSVRAAADKLDMNPSVVSRQISQLEAELAITLIERHGRGIRSTDAGAMPTSFRHPMTPSTRSRGVVSTLPKESCPVSESNATRSVNVPPISVPMKRAMSAQPPGALNAVAIASPMRTLRPGAQSGWNRNTSFGNSSTTVEPSAKRPISSPLAKVTLDSALVPA